jgi:hypothetical protein
MAFTGKLLKRGFWLYVWDIRGDRRQHLYIGRTGDSSSTHASSPFRRIGQHLDSRLNAKGNALLRQLRAVDVDPEACIFEMTAIGPIFDEQETFEKHVPLRDKTASLEGALATELKNRGYSVIGKHPPSTGSDPALFTQVIQKLDEIFPDRRVRPLLEWEPIQLPAGSLTASEIIIQDRGQR